MYDHTSAMVCRLDVGDISNLDWRLRISIVKHMSGSSMASS